MKTIFVALLFVAVAYARNAGTFAEGPACPIDDPLVSPPGQFNVSLEPILVINEGGTRGELVAIGLTSLHYVYDINLITLAANVELTLGNLELTIADANVAGWIDATPFTDATFPSGEFVGVGSARLTATDVKLNLRAALFINVIGNKVTIRELTVEEILFATLTADLGAGFLVDGAPIDWAAWSAGFKDNFDTEFAANKEAIVEKVRVAANQIVGQFTLEELLELINNIGGGVGEPCVTGGAPIKIQL